MMMKKMETENRLPNWAEGKESLVNLDWVSHLENEHLGLMGSPLCWVVNQENMVAMMIVTALLFHYPPKEITTKDNESESTKIKEHNKESFWGRSKDCNQNTI